jgi:O-antigen/teichoic acid export membrane protein
MRVASEHAPGPRPPDAPGVLASARAAVLAAVREVGLTDLSRRHASDLSWLVVGQAGALVLGIASIKLLTSMGTDAYGRYALVVTVFALLSALIFGPAEQGFLRFYFPAAERGSARTYVGVLFRGIVLAVASFGAVTALAASWAWRRADSGLALMVLAGGAFAVASAGTTPLAAMLNLLGQRRLNAILQVLERAMVVALLWSLARWGELSVTTALAAGTAGVLAAALSRTWALARVVAPDRSMDAAARRVARNDAVRSVASFGAPFAIWGLAGWLQSNSERWIIGTILTTSGVGVYAMMLTIANVLIAFPYGVMAQLFTPAAYRRLHDLDDSIRVAEGLRLIRVFVSGMVALMLASALVTLLFGRLAIAWLSSPAFAEFWYLLPVVCVGTGLFYVGQALSLVGASLNTPRIYLAPKLVAGGLALAVNAFVAWKFGLVGIAAASWVVGGVYVASVSRANARVLGRLAASEAGRARRSRLA